MVAAGTEPRRGAIWWARLPDPGGSQPGYRRPVLVVSADAFNRSRLRTVLTAAITSNLALAEAPGNVAVPAEESGLPRDSVVNVSQLVTLDRTYLRERAGGIPDDMLDQLDRGLRLVLDK